MNKKNLWRLACLTLAMGLFAVPGAFAQYGIRFSGLISDYTPVTGVSGPWEMRGEWSLDIHPILATADFSATLDMTHSDYWVVLNPGLADDNGSSGRHPHTHHIRITHGTLAPTSGGFSVTGPVYITADGSPAPFMAKCSSTSPCTLTVTLSGGSDIAVSNLTMTFSGPPTGHFGMQAIHGVVRTRR